MTDVVADAYATMAEFRLFVRNAAITDATDPDTNEELVALEAAARVIDVHCNRSFRPEEQTASERIYTARWIGGEYRYAVYTDDFFDDTGLEVSYDTTGDGDWGDPLTTYRLLPLSPLPGKPYTGLLFNRGTAVGMGKERIAVTALWGWEEIPSAVKLANLMQAARFLKRRDAPFGVAGSPDMGNELRLLAKLDPDVAVLLSGYVRYF